MAAFVFNIAKGKIAQLASLPASGDLCKAILLKSSGLVSDATLLDYATVSALLAGASDEADFTGYSRQTLTSLTVTVDNTNDRVDIDCADPSWSPTSAQALGKIVFYYDPDGTSTDSQNIPLFADDFVFTTPTSGTVTYQVASSGFARDS